MPAPALTRRDTGIRPGGRPGGLVLMLHGGQADGLGDVDDGSASWRRSHWMMNQVAGRLNRAGADVWLLRYGVRGWNARRGSPPSPVPDARWALDQVRRERGDVPVVLLGHSMGGRTAVAVADDPTVVGVVALAPWLPPGEPDVTLAGKRFSAAHGRSDRITSFRQTQAFCRAAERVASTVELHDMGRVGHYMLRRIPAWNAFAVSRSLAMIFPDDAPDRGVAHPREEP
jgi:predicted alpha/beta-hydrolase family hydrolase